MPLNGSELLDDPFNTIFSPFTDILSTGFWLIPLTFITIALYVKTRDVTTVSMFMIASGILLSAGTIFSEYPEMAFLYMIFTTFGIVGVIVSIFFHRE